MVQQSHRAWLTCGVSHLALTARAAADPETRSIVSALSRDAGLAAKRIAKWERQPLVTRRPHADRRTAA